MPGCGVGRGHIAGIEQSPCPQETCILVGQIRQQINTITSSIQSLSQVQLLQAHGLEHTRPPSPLPNSQSLLKLMSIESVMPSNHLILCHPLLLLPSVFPESGSFQMSQYLASGGQSIGVSVSASVPPMNIQD